MVIVGTPKMIIKEATKITGGVWSVALVGALLLPQKQSKHTKMRLWCAQCYLIK